MLEKNTRIKTLVKLLDARARITIWKSETEKLFDGCVYQLYDKNDYDSMYIKHMSLNMDRISIIITEEYETNL